MSKQSSNRGPKFELLAGAYFQRDGYLVRTSIPFRLDPSAIPISDVDLLAFRFAPSFALQKAVCDCKYRVRSRPFERVLWIKGLATFLRATSASVALPKPNLDATRFAKIGGVRVLSEDLLNSAAAKGYGLMNPQSYSEIQKSLARVLRTDKNAARLLNYARFLFLSDDPFVALNDAINNLIEAATYLSSTSESDKSQFASWRYIAAEYVVVLTLQILLIVSETAALQPADRSQHIKQRLTFGNLSPNKAREIFEIATELALQTSRDRRKTMTGGLNEGLDAAIEPPQYADSIVGLVERAVATPDLYCELPQIIDFLLFDQSLPTQGFNEDDFACRFGRDKLQERLKIARNIFSFVRDATKLNLKFFWPSSANNLPSHGISGPGPQNSTPELGLR
jgi:hypothetical protein